MTMGIKNLHEFEVDIRKFAQLIEADVLIITRRIALDLLRRIILKTPVDTGQARSNWHVGLGNPDRTVVFLDEERKLSANEAASVAIHAGTGKINTAGVFQTIYISNNLPYIVVLEKGSSRQSPEGMVEISIAEVENALASIISSL